MLLSSSPVLAPVVISVAVPLWPFVVYLPLSSPSSPVSSSFAPLAISFHVPGLTDFLLQPPRPPGPIVL